jgi:opacity protein-like surface antigen
MNSALKSFGKLVVICAGVVVGGGQASAQFESAAAPAAPAAAASDSLDRGWDTTGGLIFGLQNIFQDPGILESYRGFGFGAQYNLGNTSALRFGLDLTRTSNPVYVVTNTAKVGGTEVKTEALANTGGPTSTLGVGVGVDYLVRMNTSAVSPYFGGGIALDWASVATSYEDDITVSGETTTVDDSASSVGVGLQGVVGIGWRVHQSFSLFAEYSLGFDLLRRTSVSDSTVVRNAGGTTEVATEGAQNRILNFDLGLAQGASLGVIAYF